MTILLFLVRIFIVTPLTLCQITSSMTEILPIRQWWWWTLSHFQFCDWSLSPVMNPTLALALIETDSLLISVLRPLHPATIRQSLLTQVLITMRKIEISLITCTLTVCDLYCIQFNYQFIWLLLVRYIKMPISIYLV